MSGGAICKCSERSEPLQTAEGSNRPARLWRVVDHMCNHSAFNGYHWTFSQYSGITCLRCGAHWRTRARYVVKLKDFDHQAERSVSAGYTNHREAMARWGREPLS